MTEGGITQIILASATFISSLGAVLIGLLNTRRIKEVHNLTNSLATKAQELARATGLAEGNIQGRQEQTAEQKAV